MLIFFSVWLLLLLLPIVWSRNDYSESTMMVMMLILVRAKWNGPDTVDFCLFEGTNECEWDLHIYKDFEGKR